MFKHFECFKIYNLESILTIVFLNIIILFFVNNEINYLKVSISVTFFTILFCIHLFSLIQRFRIY